MIAVIPAYMPDYKMLDTIADLKRNDFTHIVVVNDGSGPEYTHVFNALPDGTTLLTHEQNRGKGRALKTAFAWVAENYAGESVVVVDADGQHLIEDVMRVREKAEKNINALVMGSRMFAGSVPFRSRFGNSVTRVVFTLASGVRLADTQTGLRVIPANRLAEFCALKGERYEYEMNMLLYAAEEGVMIIEVPIETVYIENNNSSHFNILRDSFKIYAVILKFACSSFASFLIDFAMLFVFQFVFKAFPESQCLLYSVVCARIVSSACNFFINKKLVFRKSGNTLSSVLKYYLIVVIVLAANYGIIWVLNIAWNWPLAVAKIVTEAVLFFFSFTMQRLFVFKRKTTEEKA